MPAWMQIVLGLFGGGFLTELLALIRSREGPLWQEIERLNKSLDARDADLKSLRQERDAAVWMLQATRYEVNELLEELHRPAKYDTAAAPGPKGE